MSHSLEDFLGESSTPFSQSMPTAGNYQQYEAMFSDFDASAPYSNVSAPGLPPTMSTHSTGHPGPCNSPFNHLEYQQLMEDHRRVQTSHAAVLTASHGWFTRAVTAEGLVKELKLQLARAPSTSSPVTQNKSKNPRPLPLPPIALNSALRQGYEAELTDMVRLEPGTAESFEHYSTSVGLGALHLALNKAKLFDNTMKHVLATRRQIVDDLLDIGRTWGNQNAQDLALAARILEKRCKGLQYCAPIVEAEGEALSGGWMSLAHLKAEVEGQRQVFTKQQIIPIKTEPGLESEPPTKRARMATEDAVAVGVGRVVALVGVSTGAASLGKQPAARPPLQTLNMANDLFAPRGSTSTTGVTKPTSRTPLAPWTPAAPAASSTNGGAAASACPRSPPLPFAAAHLPPQTAISSSSPSPAIQLPNLTTPSEGNGPPPSAITNAPLAEGGFTVPARSNTTTTAKERQSQIDAAKPPKVSTNKKGRAAAELKPPPPPKVVDYYQLREYLDSPGVDISTAPIATLDYILKGLMKTAVGKNNTGQKRQRIEKWLDTDGNRQKMEDAVAPAPAAVMPVAADLGDLVVGGEGEGVLGGV